MADDVIPPAGEGFKLSPYNWPDAICRSCAHWMSGLSDFEEYAQCRRFPPVRSETTVRTKLAGGPNKGATFMLGGVGEWPVTNLADSCGEHKVRVR